MKRLLALITIFALAFQICSQATDTLAPPLAARDFHINMVVFTRNLEKSTPSKKDEKVGEQFIRFLKDKGFKMTSPSNASLDVKTALLHVRTEPSDLNKIADLVAKLDKP